MKKELDGALGEINKLVNRVEEGLGKYKTAIEQLPKDTKKAAIEFEEAIKDFPLYIDMYTEEQEKNFVEAEKKRKKAFEEAALDTKNFTKAEKEIHAKAVKDLSDATKSANEKRKEYGDILESTSKKIHEDELIGGKQHTVNMETVGEERLEGEKARTETILDLQERLKKGFGEVDKALAKEDPDKAHKEKWETIAKDTKDYTDAVNGALTNMFGATTKYMEKKKR